MSAMTMVFGLVLGAAVAFGVLWDRERTKGRKLTAERDAAKKHRDDLETAIDADKDALATIAAREWCVLTSRQELVYYQMSLYSAGLDYSVPPLSWKVNGYDAPTLAEAYAKACAYHDAAEKVKAQFSKKEATP